jgi:hypothetical protein
VIKYLIEDRVLWGAGYCPLQELERQVRNRPWTFLELDADDEICRIHGPCIAKFRCPFSDWHLTCCVHVCIDATMNIQNKVPKEVSSLNGLEVLESREKLGTVLLHKCLDFGIIKMMDDKLRIQQMPARRQCGFSVACAEYNLGNTTRVLSLLKTLFFLSGRNDLIPQRQSCRFELSWRGPSEPFRITWAAWRVSFPVLWKPWAF